MPSGAYPTRRVTRLAARASEISNVVVFVKDGPRAGRPGAGARADGPAGRSVRAAPRGHPARIDGGVSQQRSVLPQRLLAVARRDLRSRTVSARREPLARLHPARTREGLLPPALAHEREHHGVRSPALRRARRRRAASCSAMFRPARTASAPGTSASAKAPRTSSSRPDARSGSSSRCRWTRNDGRATPPRFVVRTTVATLVMVAGVLTSVFVGVTLNVRQRVRCAVSDKLEAGQRMLVGARTAPRERAHDPGRHARREPHAQGGGRHVSSRNRHRQRDLPPRDARRRSIASSKSSRRGSDPTCWR